MKRLGVVLWYMVVLVGCGPSAVADAPVVESDPADAVELQRANELTQQVLQIRLDEIPDDVDQDAALEALLEYKTTRGKQAQDAWEKLGKQPKYRQLSRVRIAQAYLNFSCSIMDSPTPAQLADEERQRYRGVLADAALKVMINADEALAEAVAADAGIYEGVAADDLRGRIASSAEEVPDSCEATRSEWMPANPISGREMLDRACASRESGCDLTPKDGVDEDESDAWGDDFR